MTCISIVSGGLDSVTMAYWLANEGYVQRLLSFDYGQRHVKELESAQRCADALNVAHTVVDLHSVTPLLWGSSLTDLAVDVPDGHYAAPSMAATVVPNRNAIMMNIAAGIALARGHLAIATAVHAGDHAIYPDCRPVFVRALEKTIRIATDTPTFSVLAPFVNISKTDIVRDYGARVDYAMTWSCYEGGEQHCGKCGTCVERIEAFTDSNTEDPTEYKTA